MTAKTGPVKLGNTSELQMTEYDSIAAIAKASPLNPYAIYVNRLVLNILENAERRTTLSNVSTGIIPKAKNLARIRATCIPRVADAATVNVNADIWVAVSKPSPNTRLVTRAEPKGPIIWVLFTTLLARIAEPVLPYFFKE
jgi:hypothetical protein